MDYSLKNCAVRANTEPEDKYGVHFEYHDLCQRLLLVKKQREQKSKIFKSFDKDPRKKSNPPRIKHKSKSSLRSDSTAKNPKRGISSDFMKITKAYSPVVKRKVSSPERFLGSLRLPQSILTMKTIKKRFPHSRITKSRVDNKATLQ